MTPALLMTRRVAQLLVGLFAYGFAIAMMIRAAIGISPWDVLSQGIVLHTGLNYAVITNAVGALVLLLWIPIRQKPGIGTVANVLLIGPSIEVGLWLLPAPDDLVPRIPCSRAGSSCSPSRPGCTSGRGSAPALVTGS